MKIAVLGGSGGLGRNVVDAALAVGHDVSVLVRDPQRAALPPSVAIVVGDATREDDVVRVMEGAAATVFCVNPPFGTWLSTFPPLLDTAILAAKRTGTRLIFPANVWIYGPGPRGALISETRAPSATSKRGALRARMEQQIRDAGIRHVMIRLPEFYGPHVTTLTARAFRAALDSKRTLWPGPLEVEVELVYMPDAARALVTVATAVGCDADVFHLPGTPTRPREFLEKIYAVAGSKPRMSSVPGWMLSLAGMFDATARGAADIDHVWTFPVLLDGTRYRARFGEVPRTPLDDAIATTLAWHRARPALRMQG